MRASTRKVTHAPTAGPVTVSVDACLGVVVACVGDFADVDTVGCEALGEDTLGPVGPVGPEGEAEGPVGPDPGEAEGPVGPDPGETEELVDPDSGETEELVDPDSGETEELVDSDQVKPMSW